MQVLFNSRKALMFLLEGSANFSNGVSQEISSTQDLENFKKIKSKSFVHNVPKWSDILQKCCKIRLKICKVCDHFWALCIEGLKSFVWKFSRANCYD